MAATSEARTVVPEAAFGAALVFATGCSAFNAAVEQRVSERLLLNVLPGAIAERLKAQGGVNAASLLDAVDDGFLPLIADSDPDVTVLFADIVGFTRLSADVAPQKVVVMLNEIFTDFDGIADRRGLEKGHFRIRRFTVKELCRLFTFPDDYVAPSMTVNAAYETFGKAVVVRVIEHVVSEVVRARKATR